MFDHVVVLDKSLSCPHGHRVGSFQTKSFGDASMDNWGDLVDERQLWVEFRATFGPDGLRQIERRSGTRDDLMTELRREGLRVIGDDEPLAIAHRELRAARDAPPRRRSRTRR